MSESEVLLAVTEMLTEVQSLGDHPKVPINGATMPIGQLEGFDSIVAIEVTARLEKKLGVDLNGLKSDSLFVTPSKKALTVDQSVKRLVDVINGAKA